MDAFTRSAVVAVAWASLLPFSPTHTGVAAQQPPPAAPVELRPGVVVDPGRRIVYVMNPKGGIDALRLDRGGVLWHSEQAARPLAVADAVLVAQVEAAAPGNQLRVRTLDARTGRSRQVISHALPEGTRATVVGNVQGSFTVQAVATGMDATLAWEFVDRPLQGVKPGALDVDAPPAADRAAAAQAQPPKLPTTTGVVRIDLSSGRVSAVPGDKPAFAPRRADVAPEARVGGVTGAQFVSADGRHVLTSERVADDSVWEKYEWTVFERASGRRVGALRDYRSHAPFMVVGSTIFYETGPYELRTEKGLVSEPLRLRAVDLTKGTQLWAREIRDTTYRGPFPG